MGLILAGKAAAAHGRAVGAGASPIADGPGLYTHESPRRKPGDTFHTNVRQDDSHLATSVR
jgi:hypothetical protein